MKKQIDMPELEFTMTAGRCENGCCAVVGIKIEGERRTKFLSEDRNCVFAAWTYLGDVLRDEFGIDVTNAKRVDIVVDPTGGSKPV